MDQRNGAQNEAKFQECFRDLRGYHRLAAAMSRNGDLVQVRKFGFMNYLNLLAMQAELINLQNEFQVVAKLDNESTEFAVNFGSCKESTEFKDQWCLLKQIRKKLKEYSEFQSLKYQ